MHVRNRFPLVLSRPFHFKLHIRSHGTDLERLNCLRVKNVTFQLSFAEIVFTFIASHDEIEISNANNHVK